MIWKQTRSNWCNLTVCVVIVQIFEMHIWMNSTVQKKNSTNAIVGAQWKETTGKFAISNGNFSNFTNLPYEFMAKIVTERNCRNLGRNSWMYPKM